MIFPLTTSALSSGHQFVTTVTTKGFTEREQRIRQRMQSREKWNASYMVKTLDDVIALRDFFLAVNGRWQTFLFKDPTDYQLESPVYFASPGQNTIQLEKVYQDYLGNEYKKIIRKPDYIELFVDTGSMSEDSDYTLDYETGLIDLVEPISDEYYYNGEFYKNVRFDTDELNLEMLAYWVDNQEYGLVQPPDIPLVEVFT